MELFQGFNSLFTAFCDLEPSPTFLSHIVLIYFPLIFQYLPHYFSHLSPNFHRFLILSKK